MINPIVLVWLKRDLRIFDHEAFTRAIETDLPIYAFYLYEPTLLSSPDMDIRHLRFIRESIEDMNQKLEPYRAKIHTHFHEGVIFFEKVTQLYEIKAVFSHQETGNYLSFQRDIQVKNFLISKGIPWYEYKPSYIIRGLKSGRVGWKEKWKTWMESAIQNPNWEKSKEKNLFINQKIIDESDGFFIKNNFFLISQESSKDTTHIQNFQKGGTTEAENLLQSFLKFRYKNYSKHISKPEESRFSCSRLSPYLAWGNLSARYVYQKTMRRRSEVNSYGKRQLDNFLSRLIWRDHMIQKFESECRIEFENFNPGYDCLIHEKKEAWIQAWQTGNTGFPLIDASMRCVLATGYLNFRMRAMLVSFLTMILWQDWRWGVHHLARNFLDYEPGIHYFQFQMQASTVGNHQIRIYNPKKQIQDHDPHCMFIKKWIPELTHLPVLDILNWGEEQGLFFSKTSYPLPIVDFTTAYQKAKDVMFQLQKSPEVQKHLQQIREKHVIDRKEKSF